jgi:hypothetical protein
MDIHSQLLMELQMNPQWALIEALKTTFQDIKIKFGDHQQYSRNFKIFNKRDIFMERDIHIHHRKNIIKKHMLGMILRPIVMIGIWIVVISGMTTTFIFYLMTLLHLM